MVEFSRNLLLRAPMQRGEDVAALQGTLRIAVDGFFGPDARAAVLAFQTRRGLTPDGIVGRATWGAVFPEATFAPTGLESDARICFDTFTQKNWTPEQACGLLANLIAESSLRPTATGDDGHAYGIAQWHEDRQAEFARLMQKDIRGSSLQDQLQFVHLELTVGRERRACQQLRAATTASAAGAVVSRFYSDPPPLMNRPASAPV